MKRTRVLHIVLDLEAGGLERLVADLVRRIDPRAFESHVLAVNFLGRYAKGLAGHGGVHCVGQQSRWSMIRPQRMTACIRRIAPDVVHTHSGVWYKASLSARRAGIPRIVHTDHGRPVEERWSARVVDRWASRRTHAVVAVSDPLAQQLVERVGVDPKLVRVIVNGVDINLYSAQRGVLPNGELWGAAGRPVIGSVGRFDAVKGYDIVLDAFARLLAAWVADPKPFLVLLGEGPEEQALKRQVSRLGLGGDVCMPGWRDNVHEILPRFDLFTLGSLSEGTSVSLLEAMSCGVCPVVTDVGGNRRVLGSELRHRLVPARRPDALAAACREALTHPERRAADASAARRQIEQHFSLDVMTAAYEGVYRDVG